MLPKEDLERLMVDMESDRVERKESLANRDRIGQAICAFANDLPDHRQPGYIFVGVDDRGRSAGLQIDDELLRNLAGFRSEGNILPPPTLVVQRHELHGTNIAVVEVQPSDWPPVRFYGQVWIRVGPRRAIATAEEERRLVERRTARARTFDQRPCLDASIADLVMEGFRGGYLPNAVDRQILEQNERTTEEQLASLRFFDLTTAHPTHAGVLLFGRSPLDFMPGAYVQFVRFEGPTLADSIQDEKTITGNLLTQFQQLDNLLPLQIRTRRRPSLGLQHEEIPDYPLVAIREVVMNAIMHRNYEGTNAPVRINWFPDRVEVQNPGGLYGQVNAQNFRQATDYRNPVVAEAMKVIGLVERFGVGIARIDSTLRKNGNPEAEFTFEPAHVLVTIRGLA